MAITDSVSKKDSMSTAVQALCNDVICALDLILFIDPLPMTAAYKCNVQLQHTSAVPTTQSHLST